MYIDCFKEAYEREHLFRTFTLAHEAGHEFGNILRYINKTYKISTIQLANRLNISRQTLHNYYNRSTMELPKIIKDKIIVLYGCDSFDDYLKIEFVNSIKQLIIDDLDERVQSEDQFKKIKDELKYYFQITKSTYGYRISLKNQFDSSRRWKRVKLSLDNKQIFDLEKHIIANEFLINNSNEYLLKLFNQLDKLEPNSQRLLNYISKLNKEVNNGDR